MTNLKINENIREKLLNFLKKNKKADLVSCYLYFIEISENIQPVLFPKEKKIYQDLDLLIKELESQNKLARETVIKIQLGTESVNNETKKIYICPFSGKVFGDNTHPNPQDAIYDWVSKCKENTERVGGLRAKRFFVSEDPKIIQSYMKERKSPIEKVVYSSGVSGKLFNNKEDVIKEFKKSYVKKMSLQEVQNQNRFEIEENFLQFFEEKLTEEEISKFVETLSEYKEFVPYVNKWLES